MIIERRQHLGGNIHCENINDICVHKYGPHIFHTDNPEIWKFVNSFVPFNNFTLHTIANYQGQIYSLPFNMNTFNKMWNVITPFEAMQRLEIERKDRTFRGRPHNLEEKAIHMVGREIYEYLIKGYTEKQWGRPCSKLPTFIMKRIPVRFTYNNNYFSDLFQGIPEGGYNLLINGLTNGIECKTCYDYLKNKEYFNNLADRIVYTGSIDEYFGYRLGPLEYRSLKFEYEILPISNYQGNAIVNYTSTDIPYTRIVEHKYFDITNQLILNIPYTVISREYPMNFDVVKNDPYYPVNDEYNNSLYQKYKEIASLEQPNVIFGGRLGEYKYYDMDDVIASSINLFNIVENDSLRI